MNVILQITCIRTKYPQWKYKYLWATIIHIISYIIHICDEGKRVGNSSIDFPNGTSRQHHVICLVHEGKRELQRQG